MSSLSLGHCGENVNVIPFEGICTFESFNAGSFRVLHTLQVGAFEIFLPWLKNAFAICF